MLIEYDSVIPNDPKQVISDKYEAVIEVVLAMWVEHKIDVDLLACLLGCSSSLHCNIGAVGVYNPLYLRTMG